MRKWTIALLLAFISSTAGAQEQQTAYEALRVVARQLNRGYLNRIISINGVEGDPQPMRWNILLADRNAPGGVREVQVANGRIVSNQPTQSRAGASESASFTATRLNLDSNGAFKVASYTADKSHVNFDRVTYTLRTNERGLPVWIVTLQSETRQPLGTIHINANRGNVTRVEGLYHGANMAQVEEDHGDNRGAGGRIETSQSNEEQVEIEGERTRGDGEEEDENAVKRSIKRMFYRTRDDAEHMFHRVRRSFADFIAGG